jgi:sulfite exporter TauE/SafE
LSTSTEKDFSDGQGRKQRKKGEQFGFVNSAGIEYWIEQITGKGQLMQTELEILIVTAVGIACLHTITGPDHYLPFIALSRSRGWSFWKTICWTIVCGCGHVWSSVLLGMGGAAIGWSLTKVNWLEQVRGGIAAWALVIFGLLYAGWGFVKAQQGQRHKHFDVYEDGSVYVYEHRHGQPVNPGERHRVTPWVMFLIFVLGPCEPMIPLLYFPAAKNSPIGMLLLVVTYTICTLASMLSMVIMGYYGFGFLQTAKLERYMHALGGITILVCGAGMVFLGW